MEWQKIESAPRDGTHIFGIDEDINQHGFYNQGVVMFNNGEWESLFHYGLGMDIGFYPTHWQPLPLTPTIKRS